MLDLDTSPQDKRKSFLIATLLYAMLLVLLFFIRFWPPSDYEMASLAGGGGGGGMEVNFGDSELGKGDDYKSEVLDVKENSSSTPTASQPEEEIIATDNDDENTTVITKNPTPKTHTPKPIIKDIKQPKPEKPKVKQSTNDALSSILSGNNRGGDGNDNVGGNKGNSNGNINSGGYYGTGGSGGGTGGGHGSGNGTGNGAGSGNGSGGGNGSGNGLGNGAGYSLAGRKALTKPAPDYNCNEEGVVVVQITVDKNGNVVEAKPGARGTTNTASCLTSQAKAAAMRTKWSPSPDGAEKQVGTIRYNFSLKD
jgi:TonB family protein